MAHATPFLVCLTGGVASGKTYVSDQFASENVEVIDTDLLARQVVLPDSQGLQAIVEAFGPDVLQSDGTLDRPKLRGMVFSDKNKRLKLNQITHPLIRHAVMSAIEGSSAKLIVVVIPLYHGQPEYRFFDRVCVVDVAKEMQLDRLQQRDGVSLALAEDMVSAQLDRVDRLQLADDVLVNNKSVEVLEANVNKLLAYYQQYII